MATRKSAVVDHRTADLKKVDGEIARLKELVADKQKALETDVAQHIDRMDFAKQDRLTAEIKKLQKLIAEQTDKRFKIELGEVEPSKPVPSPAPVQHRSWEIENLPEPEYPGIARTAENHTVFSEAFEKFVHFHIDHKYRHLKSAGLHPDQRVDQELLAIVAGVANAHHAWLSNRCHALEARVAELESKPSVEYRGVWKPDEKYQRGHLVTHQGSVWHCELAGSGIVPGNGATGWRLAVKRGDNGKDAR